MKKSLSITILFLLLTIVLSQPQDAVADAEDSGEQLVINRAMLSSGSEDAIRSVAAKQILIDPKQAAKDIIVEVLENQANPKAIEAVCRAIAQSSKWEKDIQYPEAYISPLIALVKTGSPKLADYAATGLTVYPYEDIKPEIEKILSDEKADQQAKLNAINVISMRLTDKQAIEQMISLLEDTDPEIAEQAGKALQEWVPMGTNKDLWNYVRNELKQKSPEEIVRDRLASQEAKVKELTDKNKTLTEELVEAFETIYQSKSDSEAKSKFLVQSLKKPMPDIRLWAVEKISSWRSGSDLPKNLTDAVIGVIDDENADVRLAAAKLMVYMADANPSEKLKAQLQNEKQANVQIALLEALAESCYFAMLSSSDIKPDKETRIYTLDKASEFLKSQTEKRAITGAEVIRKLIEKNGLKDETAEKYIKNVNERYQQAREHNPDLAAKMLDVMSKYCLPDFHYRSISLKTYKPVFTSALTSGNASIRRPAAEGLVNIDKSAALKTFIEKQMYNDPDEEIVKMIIQLAKEVGNGDCYSWLSDKIKKGVEGSWQAMTAILQRADVSIVEKAVTAIDSYDIDNSRKIEIFEIGRKKAGIQYKTTLLLAQFYLKNSNFEKSAELYQWLLQDAAGKPEAIKDAENAIKALLGANKIDAVGDVVKEILNDRDIKADGAIAKALSKAVNNENKELKTALLGINVPEPRSEWKKLTNSWKQKPAEKPEKSAEKQEQKPKQPENKPEKKPDQKDAESDKSDANG